MSYPYYRKDKIPNPGQDLPPPWKRRPANAEERAQEMKCYQAGDGLVHAFNAALTLGQPLLLTGEAGSGKTVAAYHLAWYLGLDEAFKFETKSTSNARDLFYTYDIVGHFRASQLPAGAEQTPVGGTLKPEVNPLEYFSLNPLGLAILLSQPQEQLNARPHLRQALDTALEQRGLPAYSGPRRSLVLIDEIDKAPRDFPNDLLNEVEEMYFRIPELAQVFGSQAVRAAESQWPVVVITSNSEKHLPEPFLRRCVFHHIAFPDAGQMKKIIEAQASGFSDALLNDVLGLFYKLREDGRLRKKPSTAELLGWLQVLREVFKKKLDDPDDAIHKEARPLAANPESTCQTLYALIKVSEDQTEELEPLFKEWLGLAAKPSAD
jgi:MoxR-like ATPase